MYIYKYVDMFVYVFVYVYLFMYLVKIRCRWVNKFMKMYVYILVVLKYGDFFVQCRLCRNHHCYYRMVKGIMLFI
jgi:hypothetical protein